MAAGEIPFALVVMGIAGCGVVAGVFFAFSTFVMAALARLPAAQAIAAMQSINIVAVTVLFMTALFGTALLCLVLAFMAASAWPAPRALLVVAGSALYLAGTIVVTIACNVPLNNRLAAVAPSSQEGAALWPLYHRRWTAWNHVRTIAALAAAMMLTVALCV